MSLLELKGVTKIYGKDFVANDDISLVIDAGEVYGLLGPNGAGKTTLVSQIIGLAAPTSGSLRLNGVDIVANPGYARQVCSYQPQSQVPIDGVTVRQAIEIVGRIRGGKKKYIQQRALTLINSLEIDEWANKDGATLSGGVKRLTAFCMAAVAPGDLVILDEPTNDIDPLRRKLLWLEVRRIADRGSAVLLVTHNVLEAERSVDRLAIMDRGQVLASGTSASLKGNENGYYRLELTLEPSGGCPDIPDFVSSTARTGRRIMGRLDASDISLALQWAKVQRSSGKIEEYSIGPATLEDVYIQLVGRSDVLAAPAEEVQNELRDALVK